MGWEVNEESPGIFDSRDAKKRILTSSAAAVSSEKVDVV